MCSDQFTTLGQAQAGALGFADLPIATIPHPFGLRNRDEVRQIAEQCVDEVARLVVRRPLPVL